MWFDWIIQLAIEWLVRQRDFLMAREIVGPIEGAAIQSATINPVTLSVRRRRFILNSKGGRYQVFMGANECIHPGSMEMSITGCSLHSDKTAMATHKSRHWAHGAANFQLTHFAVVARWFCAGLGQFAGEPLAFSAIIMGVAMAEDNNLVGHPIHLSPPRCSLYVLFFFFLHAAVFMLNFLLFFFCSCNNLQFVCMSSQSSRSCSPVKSSLRNLQSVPHLYVHTRPSAYRAYTHLKCRIRRVILARDIWNSITFYYKFIEMGIDVMELLCFQVLATITLTIKYWTFKWVRLKACHFHSASSSFLSVYGSVYGVKLVRVLLWKRFV